MHLLQVILAAILLLGLSARDSFCQATYEIEIDLFSGGGGETLSPGYRLISTIGQATPVGVSSGGGYVSRGGIWQALSAEIPVNLRITPNEGTLGTEVRIEGEGFGAQKGKLLLGTTALKVLEWNPAGIIRAILTKAPVPALYDVTAVPKVPKGADPIIEPGGFRVMPPQIDSTPLQGAPEAVITLTGNYFGAKKGKISLEKDGETYSCKVTRWTMVPETGASTAVFTVSKKVVPGDYTLRITNKVTSATTAFRVE
jgi:hypothetical protein